MCTASKHPHPLALKVCLLLLPHISSDYLQLAHSTRNGSHRTCLFSHLKNLITVNFTPLARSSTSITPAPPSKSICSCCSKELSNATTSVLIKVSLMRRSRLTLFPSHSGPSTVLWMLIMLLLLHSQGCGHVVCSPCVDKVIKKGKQCVSCEGSAKEKELIELKRDGTGFAAAGNAESVKVSRYVVLDALLSISEAYLRPLPFLFRRARRSSRGVRWLFIYMLHRTLYSPTQISERH
jgi:hypothetical protein